jgi:hypothetical protein
MHRLDRCTIGSEVHGRVTDLGLGASVASVISGRRRVPRPDNPLGPARRGEDGGKAS